MTFRISPAWWPLLGLSFPALLPMLFIKNRRYNRNKSEATKVNQLRMEQAGFIDMPELERFELTPLVEQKAGQGFLASTSVSYLINTDVGSILFDVGYGSETPALAYNAARIGFNLDQVDGLVISHLHPDHMGGFKAARSKTVSLPAEIIGTKKVDCFLPAESEFNEGKVEVVTAPRLLAGGVASTGPLARSLFLMGWTEEQAIVARLKDKGLVIVTGCGHPTIEVIVDMVRCISDEPIYAIGGGLHFPVTDSPFRKPGLKVQMIWGTGKPPWRKIEAEDLEKTIQNINRIRPQHVFLSAHDTCDYALDQFKNKLHGETTILKAGSTLRL